MSDYNIEPLRCPWCDSMEYPDCCERAQEEADEFLADEQHNFSD